MTDADALTIAMHAIAQIRHEVARDPNIEDEEVRQSRLDELDEAHARLRELRNQHRTFSFPVPKLRAKDGDVSTDPTATTPTADAACAEPADSTV